MKKSNEWTFGRTLLFLLLTLDISVIALWLIKYYSVYQEVATVVSGIWAAVIAILAILGIKAEKGNSFPYYFGLRPVKAIILTYTLLIFSGSVVFIFWEFEVHRLEIKAVLPEGLQNVKMELTASKAEEAEPYVNESDHTVVYLKQGSYHLKVAPADESNAYEGGSREIEISPFSTNTFLTFTSFRPKRGKLIIENAVPDDLLLTVFNADDGKEVFEGQFVMRPIPLEAANYKIVAQAKDYYQKELIIHLERGQEHRVPLELTRIPSSKGNLIIERTAPDTVFLTIFDTQGGASVYEGQVFDHPIVLEAGQYKLVATAEGYYNKELILKLERGKDYNVPLLLTKKPPPVGTVKFQTGSTGINVLVDEKRQLSSTVSLAPGMHRIVFYKQSGDDRFGFYEEREIEILENRTIELSPPSAKIRLPVIEIIPAEDGFAYRLESDRYGSKEIGSVSSGLSREYSLLPGSYVLTKSPLDPAAHSIKRYSFHLKPGDSLMEIRF